MAKIEVHHKSELLATTFTSTDLTTVADQDGLTLVWDAKEDLLRLKLNWAEYGGIWSRVVKYLNEHDPDRKLLIS